MEGAWILLKFLGVCCLIVLAALVLMILVACFVAVWKAITEKK